MASTKPYLIRAIHEWCSDEGYTPYLAVQVNEQTRVPQDFVSEGQIVLNVAVEATHQLMIGNEHISFQARFNGAVFSVEIPINAVLAIYARENSQGISFAEDFGQEEPNSSVGKETKPRSKSESSATKKPTRRPSHLTRIK